MHGAAVDVTPLWKYTSIALYFNLIVYLLQKWMDGLYVMLFGVFLWH